ncbi:MAG: hypothetical protein FWF95_04740 [Syntrophorhabdaceae bacterium]|nr:hypothetical protein [Syntrophorhabdaceae bacterium]
MTDRDEKPTYTLRTNESEYEHSDLSIAGFADYLNRFSPDYWDFMILEPSKPIKGSTFIQVGAPDERTGFKMTLEIGIFNPNKIEMYRYYTDNKAEVLHILADYFENQEIPDYKRWKDVSDEMN